MYEHLSTIKEGTQRIKTIVEDLRAFTQLDAADHKTVVLTDCLQSTINLLKTKKRAIAVFKTNFKAHPELLCYPAQLNQVFMHLIVNAAHAIVNKQKQLGSAEIGEIGIARKHGGTLGVESELGDGSLIRLVLPCGHIHRQRCYTTYNGREIIN